MGVPLTEVQPFEYKIVEERGKSKRKGVLLSLEGVFQRADTKNANGRVYPKGIWDGVMNNDAINERISKRRMLGELDHPSSGATSLNRVSHVITGHSFGADGKIIEGGMDILDTPSGQIAATLFEAGCQLGISSRGDGSVEKKGDVDEVQSDYKLETYDLVLKPSTPGAYPQIAESEEEAKKNTELIASAVEGLVNSTVDVEVLLECHKIISVLEGCESRCESILTELKSKLGGDGGKPAVTTEEPTLLEDNSMNTNGTQVPDNAPPGINLSPEMKDYLEGWVNKGVAEAVSAKNAEIASLNERIVAATGEKEDLTARLEAAEKLIDEFQRKVKDMDENHTSDDKLQERYDASVKLLDEAITRLQDHKELQLKLEATEALLAASIKRHDELAIEGVTESLIEQAGLDEETAKSYREILSTCESVTDVQSKFASVHKLAESAESRRAVREPLPPTGDKKLDEQVNQQRKPGGDIVTNRLLAKFELTGQ